jgi:hypothetical protein
MSARISVGIACPVPGERAAFTEWLDAAGYNPVPMLDLDSLTLDLDTRPIEALIADVALLKPLDLPSLLKTLTPNRPLIVVGNPGTCLPNLRRDASWLDRPVSIDTLKLSVALGLAEGRPARRSRRKAVTHLPATMDGMDSQVVDVSVEGVRLLMRGAQPSALPPFFTLRVPGFGVATVVKRIWVAQPSTGIVSCGGIVERALPNSKATWKELVELTPSSSSFVASVQL